MEQQKKLVKKETDKKRPNEYSIGQVKLVEWINEDVEGKKYSTVQVRKFYKNDADEWNETDSLNEIDLMNLRELITGYLQTKKPLRVKTN